MQHSPLDFLKHILDECRFISSIITPSFSKEQLLDNEMMKRACVRSLEIIGEATKNIPQDFKLKYNTVEWRAMAGMRDKLIHDYLGVDYIIVWDVIVNKIPILQEIIESILNIENTEGVIKH